MERPCTHTKQDATKPCVCGCVGDGVGGRLLLLSVVTGVGGGLVLPAVSGGAGGGALVVWCLRGGLLQGSSGCLYHGHVCHTPPPASTTTALKCPLPPPLPSTHIKATPFLPSSQSPIVLGRRCLLPGQCDARERPPAPVHPPFSTCPQRGVESEPRSTEWVWREGSRGGDTDGPARTNNNRMRVGCGCLSEGPRIPGVRELY